MSAQDNVDLVLAYLAARGRGDVDAALDLVADDASQRLMFAMPGSPGVWHGKEGLRGFVDNLKRLFPDGTTVTVERIHGSGDSVAVETTNSGTTFKGTEYSNRYCYIYEIVDGKISEIREYADSHYARDVLG
jgi:uncharacterized protein